MVKRTGTQILADRITALSQDDAAAVAKWRSEIGEERASTILKAIAGIPNDGRPTELKERWPLLLMMGAEIRSSKAQPHTAAIAVIRRADHRLLIAAKRASQETLVKWLTRAWAKHSQTVFKELDARPRRTQMTTMQSLRQMNNLLGQASMLQPNSELLRFAGINTYMKREPFPGYYSLLELSKRDPLMRLLRQARTIHGQDEGT